MIYKYFGIRKNTGAINVYENDYKTLKMAKAHIKIMNGLQHNLKEDGMKYRLVSETSSSYLNSISSRKVK